MISRKSHQMASSSGTLTAASPTRPLSSLLGGRRDTLCVALHTDPPANRIKKTRLQTLSWNYHKTVYLRAQRISGIISSPRTQKSYLKEAYKLCRTLQSDNSCAKRVSNGMPQDMFHKHSRLCYTTKILTTRIIQLRFKR